MLISRAKNAAFSSVSYLGERVNDTHVEVAHVLRFTLYTFYAFSTKFSIKTKRESCYFPRSITERQVLFVQVQ